MSERNEEGLGIPKGHISIQRWILVIFIPVFITLLGLTMNVVMASTNIKNKVDVNTTNIQYLDKDIKELEITKADNDDVNRNYVLLLKINDKIDNYILTQWKVKDYMY